MAVLMRDGFRCQFERPDGSKCGKLGGLLEAHHVKALADGGLHLVENGQTLCRDCHFSIHRLRPVDPERTAWAAMLKDVLST